MMQIQLSVVCCTKLYENYPKISNKIYSPLKETYFGGFDYNLEAIFKVNIVLFSLIGTPTHCEVLVPQHLRLHTANKHYTKKQTKTFILTFKWALYIYFSFRHKTQIFPLSLQTRGSVWKGKLTIMRTWLACKTGFSCDNSGCPKWKYCNGFVRFK